MSKYVGIYVDEALKTKLHTKQIDGKDVPYLQFGNLDIGQDKTYVLYLENQSTGVIEDLEITAQPINHRDVTLIIENGKAAPLKMAGVHKFYVTWRWGEKVKAGPLEALIDIKGVVANELV